MNMNELDGGMVRERGRHAREGRLLALFDGSCDAATAVGAALRRHSAEMISIEREWIDGMQAIRAAWPLAGRGVMDDGWLRRVVGCIQADRGGRVRANLGAAQRVGIFVSKRDHCIADLLQRSWSGTLPCEIALIVSNHEDCRSLAELYEVPFYCFDLAQRSKESVEADQLALLESEQVDLIVLARYMQILSPAFVARYPGRIINIHHALLPAFAGADPYRRALARGVKFIGATAHYVTATLDAGPIIEQEVVRVTHRDDAQALQRKGAELERITLARAVRLHVEDRLLPVNDRVVVFEGLATADEAILEGSSMDGAAAETATMAPAAARHWLTVEWPPSELQQSLPGVFAP
ncbi:MAG: formyltetrahydrofolate deformylase [Caldimonas sp.]